MRKSDVPVRVTADDYVTDGVPIRFKLYESPAFPSLNSMASTSSQFVSHMQESLCTLTTGGSNASFGKLIITLQ